MRYAELNIQTLRSAPNDLRAEAQALLYRANYTDREGGLLPLGQRVIANALQILENEKRILGPGLDPLPNFFTRLGISALLAHEEPAYRFLMPILGDESLLCPGCGYNADISLARAAKLPGNPEPLRPLATVITPNCPTIESLAQFLNIPTAKTAKALMFTRLSDGQFIFVVIRGDGQLSTQKLIAKTGDARMATQEEIIAHGAVPGYASPIGVRDALIVVDDLIPQETNLVVGANKSGCHLAHANHGRDYTAHLVADLLQANPGDPCPQCAAPLELRETITLAYDGQINEPNLLLTLAETYHDTFGLTLPPGIAPFDIYLMHVPGKTLDTLAASREIYATLSAAELSVLFDDRDERAGVKFNDADLLGCPLRVTVGERALQNGCVEVKKRNDKDVAQVQVENLAIFLTAA